MSSTSSALQRPPTTVVGVRAWIRANLFGSARDTVLTVVAGSILAVGIWRAARFVFVTGRWRVVEANLTSFLVGLFPRDELVRPWIALYVLAIAIGLGAGIASAIVGRETEHQVTSAERVRGALRTGWPVLLLITILLVFSSSVVPVALTVGALAAGLVAWRGGRSLPIRRASAAYLVVVLGLAVALTILATAVGWDRWGGILLTLFLAVGGITISFPLGVLLALGRRSSLPVVRVVCVGYIELIRGVPLITLLFMAAFALGFFLPRGFTTPSLVTRAMVALVVFTAAYIAEIVRGGLQSVPRGQYEAAQAVGLSPVKQMRLIVLPQALRAVIPAIVGQFISLFKDTSLVAILGLTDLLRVSQTVTSQPEFLAQGLQAETLVFASFVYWVGAYSMSRASQRLERRLGVGER